MRHLLALSLTCLCTTALAETPTPAQNTTYRYGGTGKRDPFRPFAVAAPTLQVLSHLQETDLKELKLVGTLLGAEMSALIVTPKGEGIIARVGDKIGKHGRIVAIIQDKIVVRQSLGDAASRQRFEDVTIALDRPILDSANRQGGLVRPGAPATGNRTSGSAFPQTNPSQSAASGGISSFVPPPINTAPSNTAPVPMTAPTSSNTTPEASSPTTQTTAPTGAANAAPVASPGP